MAHRRSPEWAPPGGHEEPKRIALLRWIVAGVSFTTVIALFLMMDFGRRGYHFEADRYASNVTGRDYDLSRLRVLTRCVGYIRNNYFDPRRANARKMLLAALDDVERKVPELLSDPVYTDGKITAVRVRVGDHQHQFDLNRVDDLYTLNWKLLDIFEYITPHLSETIDPKQIEYAAVNGMLKTLDPHSILLTPSIYREMKLGTTGKFGGLGIVIGVADGRIVIQSVLDGTPAQRAGLKSGDKIVQIASESTVNMSLADAVKRLRGPAGEPVDVWIMRKSFGEPRKFRVVRSNITLASVTSRLLADGVGYARVKNFQQSTGPDLKRAVERLTKEQQESGNGKLRGFVLDLRDNPGGLLDQAIEVSDLFLQSGLIVTTVGSGNTVREEKLASSSGTWSTLPLVVLVNAGSASASEIVAGAMRNNDRAVILGDRTFGKGSVQVIYDIDDAALKLTIAQYLTPGDESIQSVGIVPHVAVDPVTVNRKRVDMGLGRHGGEAQLKNHLDNAGHTRQRQSDVRVAFLEREDEDFALELGRKLAVDAGTASAKTMLARAEPIFDRAEREQTRRVTAALGKLDVDWHDGPNAKRPNLTAKLTTDRDLDRVNAGDKIRLKLEVTNRGKKPVHRVRALTSADEDLLSGLDFMLGRIPPGETRRWTVMVDVPRSLASQTIPLQAALYAGKDVETLAGTQPASARIEVVGLKRPRFAYSLQVLDEAPGQNGDGVADPGEKVTLRVRLTNVGVGAAMKTLAVIRNRGGDEAFIVDGRTWLDGLKVGESVDVDFKVELQGDLPAQGLQLDLRVTDTVLRKRLVHQLAIPFSTAGSAAPDPRNEQWMSSGPLAVHSAADVDSGILGVISGPVGVFSDARRGDLVRIPFGEDGSGWVPIAALKPAPSGQIVPNRAELVMSAQIKQPELIVNGLPQRSVSTDSLTLSGRAIFGSLDAGESPDVYIFRDQDKVYFERGQAGKVDFDASIPLNPGQNAISIYARAGRDLLYKHKIYVYRRTK